LPPPSFLSRPSPALDRATSSQASIAWASSRQSAPSSRARTIHTTRKKESVKRAAAASSSKQKIIFPYHIETK
jgi:hypothetical protein